MYLPLILLIIPLISCRSIGNETLSLDYDAISTNDTIQENPLLTTNLDLQAEIDYLKKMYKSAQNEFNDWMNRPSHHAVAVPALVGCISALSTLFVVYLLNLLCGKCKSIIRRRRIGQLSTDVSGRSKLMSDIDDM